MHYEAYAENSENVFKTIINKTIEGRGCEQLKYIATKQDEVSEPLWRAGLSIAKFCVDGDIGATKISSRHPDYSEAEMRKKLDEIKGPYTCARFDELREGVCKDCPLWGEIKSPIVLGKRIRESAGDVSVSAPVQGKKHNKILKYLNSLNLILGAQTAACLYVVVMQTVTLKRN